MSTPTPEPAPAPAALVEQFKPMLQGNWCQVLGMQLLDIRPGFAKAGIEVKPSMYAPHGYLHAGAVVSLADSCCGFGCMASLPQGAHSFTTIELKSNHLGTARNGMVECSAEMVHGGRTTQVWDATVAHRETGKTIALFRCTQMVLYPKN